MNHPYTIPPNKLTDFSIFRRSVLQSVNAIEGLLNMVQSHSGEIELLAVGPLTNLAMALNLDPQFGHKLKVELKSL